MDSTNSHSLKTPQALLIGLSILVFITILLGNLVSANQAGSACPDWPTCLGNWLPPNFSPALSSLSHPQLTLATLNYTHRIFSAISFLGILAALAYSIRIHRQPTALRAGLLGALSLTLLEVILGGFAVLRPASGLPPGVHLGFGYLTLGMLLFTTLSLFRVDRSPMRLSARQPLTRVGITAFVLTTLVIASGTLLVAQTAPNECSGQFLCGLTLPGSLLFNTHRLLTLLSVSVVMVFGWLTWKTKPRDIVLLPAATAAGVLLWGQIATGAAKVVQNSPLELQALHAAATVGVWTSLAVAAAWSMINERNDKATEKTASTLLSTRERLAGFFFLTKPLIVLLLLVTTFSGMVVGYGGIPPLSTLILTLLGGALAAGGSSAVNQYLDRELDKLMQRTARRPIPSGIVSPAEGAAFGLGLCLVAFFLLAIGVNLLSALLSLAGMIYYIVLYSILLKRATVQNIVIGGGAGAIPPLVGWAAATGGLNIPSLFLFAIIFLWTPPHFWALAIVRQKDYARAGVPMLPVVQGEETTRKQIFIYTLELVAITLILPFFGVTRQIYLFSAVLLGLGLLLYAWRLLRQGGNKTAWQMYKFSSRYLGLIFLAMVLDVLILI